MRQSLQKSGESESSVMMVLGKMMLLEYVNELHICQMEVEKTMLRNFSREDFRKNMNNDLVFFETRSRFF